MNFASQLKSFLQLNSVLKKYKYQARPHLEEGTQASVVTLFKFSEIFLRKNQKILKELNKFQGERKKGFFLKKGDEMEFEEIIKSQIDSLDPSRDENIFELLYAQRTDRTRDHYKGHICFPGGKVDEGKNDFTAGIREFEEELGYLINDQECIFLGKMPKNWNAYARSQNQLKISQIFFLSLENLDFVSESEESKNPLDIQNLVFSVDEIQDAWWVEYSFFFQKFPQEVFYLQKNNRATLNEFLRLFLNPELSKILRNDGKQYLLDSKIELKYYGLFFENKKTVPLWGLTLCLTSCMVEMGVYWGMEEQRRNDARAFVKRSREQSISTGDDEVDYYAEYVLNTREMSLDMRPYLLKSRLDGEF